MTIGLHEELDTALGRMHDCSDAHIVADVRATVDYLKAQSFIQGDRIGIVGFCFGGRVSYLAACSLADLGASVVYYGGGILNPLGSDGPSPLQQTPNINCPLLGLFGEEDQNPTPEDVAQIEGELRENNKTYQFHTYPGCGHGFHCDARSSYRPEAAQDAWTKTIAWFDQHLKA
jgi:carboxymethylenebutenolidase